MEISPDFASIGSYNITDGSGSSNGSDREDLDLGISKSRNGCGDTLTNSENGTVSVSNHAKDDDCSVKIRHVRNEDLSQIIQYNPKTDSLTVFPKKTSTIAAHTVPKCLRKPNNQGSICYSTYRNSCHTIYSKSRHFKFSIGSYAGSKTESVASRDDLDFGVLENRGDFRDGEEKGAFFVPSFHKSEDRSVKIRHVQTNVYNEKLSQIIEYSPTTDSVTIYPKRASQNADHVVPRCLRDPNYQVPSYFSTYRTNQSQTSCLNPRQFKYLLSNNMSDCEQPVQAEQVYSRVTDWLNMNDFRKCDGDSTVVVPANEIETNIVEGHSDITSITKRIEDKEMRRLYEKIVVREPAGEDLGVGEVDVVDVSGSSGPNFDCLKEKEGEDVGGCKKVKNVSAWQMYTERIRNGFKLPTTFPAILETDETVGVPLLFPFLPVLFFILSVTYINDAAAVILFCPY